MVNNHCEYISGCDWVSNDVNYAEAFSHQWTVVTKLVWCCMEHKELILPLSYQLYNNYPNPFNPMTTVRYELPEDSFVNVTVYDMLGNVVNNLINANQSSTTNQSNGTLLTTKANLYLQSFLYKIQAGDFVDTKKMILLND